MPTLLHRMLQEEFPEEQYFPIGYSSEYMQIYRRDSREKTLKLDEVVAIANDSLKGLSHEVDTIKIEGFGKPGDIIAMILKPSHFILLSPGEQACTISLGWRGQIPLTEQERRAYLSFVKGYFDLLRQ